MRNNIFTLSTSLTAGENIKIRAIPKAAVPRTEKMIRVSWKNKICWTRPNIGPVKGLFPSVSRVQPSIDKGFYTAIMD